MTEKLNIKDLLDPEKAKQHIPELTKFFETGGTWQILMGLSDEALEGQYAEGYNHYQEGALEEAISSFTTLTILNPYDPRYWFALGSSHYLAEHYEEAAHAYLLSGAIDEENPNPKFQAGISFEKSGEREQAITAYEEAIALDKGSSPHDPLAVEAKSRLANLLKS